MDSQREVEILHRIAVLERKVDQLMRRTSGAGAVEGSGSAEGWDSTTSPIPRTLPTCLRSSSLKEAKDAIERLEPQA
jgi:hypothetical protein